MPEPDCLVHGGGEDKEVVGPGDVQQITCVSGVRQEGSEIGSVVYLNIKFIGFSLKMPSRAQKPNVAPQG